MIKVSCSPSSCVLFCIYYCNIIRTAKHLQYIVDGNNRRKSNGEGSRDNFTLKRERMAAEGRGIESNENRIVNE
jgi:hypothetical protein